MTDTTKINIIKIFCIFFIAIYVPYVLLIFGGLYLIFTFLKRNNVLGTKILEFLAKKNGFFKLIVASLTPSSKSDKYDYSYRKLMKKQKKMFKQKSKKPVAMSSTSSKSIWDDYESVVDSMKK